MQHLEHRNRYFNVFIFRCVTIKILQNFFINENLSVTPPSSAYKALKIIRSRRRYGSSLLGKILKANSPLNGTEKLKSPKGTPRTYTKSTYQISVSLLNLEGRLGKNSFFSMSKKRKLLIFPLLVDQEVYFWIYYVTSDPLLI